VQHGWEAGSAGDLTRRPDPNGEIGTGGVPHVGVNRGGRRSAPWQEFSMRTLYRVFTGALIVLLGAGLAAVGVITHRVEGHYLDAAGVRLQYTDEGQGEPVLLLHGFAVNSDLNWRLPGITAALARQFRVIALDLRGHGLSGKPHASGEYGLEMVRDVPRLLDHLQLEKAHLVGYSLGGFVALKAASLYPRRLRDLTLIGAGWEGPENSAFLHALDEFADALEAGRAIGPLIARLGPGQPSPGLLHTALNKVMTGFFSDKAALAALTRSLPALTLTEQDLRSVSVPVCGIVGSRDPLRASAEAMRGQVPDFTLVLLEGAGHITAAGRSETRKVLENFLTTGQCRY
jgi:pimeloyl-ACP methyl ester carboxylesterase